MASPSQTELTANLRKLVELEAKRINTVSIDVEVDEDEEDQEVENYVIPDMVISSGIE